MPWESSKKCGTHIWSPQKYSAFSSSIHAFLRIGVSKLSVTVRTIVSDFWSSANWVPKNRQLQPVLQRPPKALIHQDYNNCERIFKFHLLLVTKSIHIRYAIKDIQQKLTERSSVLALLKVSKTHLEIGTVMVEYDTKNQTRKAYTLLLPDKNT